MNSFQPIYKWLLAPVMPQAERAVAGVVVLAIGPPEHLSGASLSMGFETMDPADGDMSWLRFE